MNKWKFGVLGALAIILILIIYIGINIGYLIYTANKLRNEAQALVELIVREGAAVDLPNPLMSGNWHGVKEVMDAAKLAGPLRSIQSEATSILAGDAARRFCRRGDLYNFDFTGQLQSKAFKTRVGVCWKGGTKSAWDLSELTWQFEDSPRGVDFGGNL